MTVVDRGRAGTGRVASRAALPARRAPRTGRRTPGETAGRGARPAAFAQARKRLFLPFVLPALLLYVAFLIVPLLGTAWISLHSWPGAGPMEWVGPRNYLNLFADPVFTTSFSNTLLLLFGGGLATFVLSFGLVMLLRDLAGRGFARSVVFFPTIVPALIVSILWGFLFQADGLVNWGLGLVGVDDPPAWLAADNQYLVILLGIVWTSVGFYTTILMAAADQIPPYLYEDCALAGANAWQRFRHVTLPLSWDVVGVCAVMWTINALKTFEFILAMAGSSNALPDISVWTVALYAYASALYPSGTPAFGAAAASSILTLALVAVLVVLIRRVMRRESVEL